MTFCIVKPAWSYLNFTYTTLFFGGFVGDYNKLCTYRWTKFSFEATFFNDFDLLNSVLNEVRLIDPDARIVPAPSDIEDLHDTAPCPF